MSGWHEASHGGPILASSSPSSIHRSEVQTPRPLPSSFPWTVSKKQRYEICGLSEDEFCQLVVKHSVDRRRVAADEERIAAACRAGDPADPDGAVRAGHVFD